MNPCSLERVFLWKKLKKILLPSLKNELSGIFKDAFDDLRKLIVYLAIGCGASFTGEKYRNRILEKIQSLEEFPYVCKRFLSADVFNGIEFR